MLAPMVAKAIKLGLESQGYEEIGIQYLRKLEDPKSPKKLSENAMIAVLDLVRTSKGGINSNF